MEDQVTPSFDIISFPSSKLPTRYIAMVYSRWLRSLRFGNNNYKRIRSKDFFKHYHDFIEKLMAKPDSIVRLAVLSDDHDVVLGFAVSREDVLDYIHVHTSFRKQGIARALMPEGITTFSHITAPALVIWQGNEKYKKLNFNPFA